MDDFDERQAAQALATIQTHQDRARRAARVPWWAYAAMFVLVAGISAANDFVTLSAAKVMAGVVLVLLIIVVAASFTSRTSLLNRARGVQPRLTFVPWVFVVVSVVGGIALRLVVSHGPGLAADVAGAVGLHDYPGTVFGVLFGAVFTALFALGQLLLRSAQPRTGR